MVIRYDLTILDESGYHSWAEPKVFSSFDAFKDNLLTDINLNDYYFIASLCFYFDDVVSVSWSSDDHQLEVFYRMGFYKIRLCRAKCDLYDLYKYFDIFYDLV